ncbi:hypothetical protein Lbir_3026 [Legionella birminghamensis]|uniref:Uncharacterized protein n=1 Tax=Legionella birminghamensis TaxID=28083 RepID=A0A378IB84_9GAMM|nr:hypothetical protein Lbir_3026 [Legionella birminghamensis]STX32042.1 Uncharacterised protein [Legionella birminghamensis]
MVQTVANPEFLRHRPITIYTSLKTVSSQLLLSSACVSEGSKRLIENLDPADNKPQA